MQNSFTEENYLKIIHSLSGRDGQEVSTNALAESTATRAASVTDMLRKLAEKGLIHYKKYQGVRLTDEGERVAIKVIRKHRLWEVFLVEKLGFGWDEVHDIAEELEHIPSEILVEKLDTFLGHPRFDPHGDPIPDSKGNLTEPDYRILADVHCGEKVLMMGVLDHAPAFLQHLDKTGITLGSVLEVLEVNEYDKSSSVQINDGQTLFISLDVSKNLLVQRV
ncbi:metal-dependent transcriptional regulator [Dyadobacter sandarakinus]|uniref:Transcriptional regulator MntR n=1 Tax=Dyadobacter sandarakinus TaxID=2747268 RepID=A0ABX7IDD8_9BACT|nr:metal-dependent transcriptional regulator [Dyadobacter sandarakinus]QRR03462.1 metal-dependent transcriptional regulator [Dyadobacter sandarakinus]